MALSASNAEVDVVPKAPAIVHIGWCWVRCGLLLIPTSLSYHTSGSKLLMVATHVWNSWRSAC